MDCARRRRRRWMYQSVGGTYFRMCNESRPIARQLEAVTCAVNECAGLLCARWLRVAVIVVQGD